jgi:hypothetical protein
LRRSDLTLITKSASVVVINVWYVVANTLGANDMAFDYEIGKVLSVVSIEPG